MRESFELLRHIYRVPRERYAANVRTLSELLDVHEFADVPVRQLSLGQRMRGDLVAALLHDPDLLYLDEPTIGLDVVAKARIRDFLTTINQERGVTVLLTSHDLADVERLCRRVVVIDHGKVVHDGLLAALVEQVAGWRTLVVTTPAPVPPLAVAALAAAGLEVVKVEGVRQWLRFRPTQLSAAAAVAAAMAAAEVTDLAIEEPSVEDVITQVYQRSR